MVFVLTFIGSEYGPHPLSFFPLIRTKYDQPCTNFFILYVLLLSLNRTLFQFKMLKFIFLKSFKSSLFPSFFSSSFFSINSSKSIPEELTDSDSESEDDDELESLSDDESYLLRFVFFPM